jgi:uncharacterized membrane protein
MLEIRHESDGYTKMIVSQNSSLTSPQRKWLVVGFLLWFTLLFCVSTALGAWPIIVFAFLAIMGVTLSFQYSLRQATHVEELIWQPHELRWELRRDSRNPVIKTFVPGWVNIYPTYSTNGDCEKLMLKVHGNYFLVAQHATYEERNQIYQYLKPKTGLAFTK